jgi:hypothetical protein
LVDDVTVISGKHDLKFGVNFRRYDVSDHNFFNTTPTAVFGVTPNGLQNFADGVAFEYVQSKNIASDVPIALWGMGLYINDDWHVKSNLKITIALRDEYNSNPVCQFNCFANFKSPFASLASVTSSDQGDVPYSADISTGLHKAFPGVDALNLSPRIGISWSPGKSAKTVISGGFGIFYDALAAGLVDDLLSNPPNAVGITVRPSAGVLPFDPAGAPAIWQASANAFSISNTFNNISTALNNLGSIFSAPNVTGITGTIHAPRVFEWNFQIQQQLSSSLVASANYVGNHSGRLPYANNWPNAYDAYGLYPGVAGINSAPADENYSTFSQVQSGAIANYDGLTFTLRKQLSHGLTAHFNYTWSHALDEASNGGLFVYGGESILSQINPAGLRVSNYGNADYDVRHLISADWVYVPSVHLNSHFLNELLGGWEATGKAYWHTGLPFSVGDDNTALGNGGGNLLATYAPGATVSSAEPGGCGQAAAVTPCLNSSAFVNGAANGFAGYTALSSQNRNQFRGPSYFDMDMALFRTFRIRERMMMKFGIQAYNILNHPNFGLPDSGVGDATFGNILGMAGTPTSPYGSFLGFDSSPRIIQLSGKVTF